MAQALDQFFHQLFAALTAERLAVLDQDFLLSESTRGARFLLEYEKADQILNQRLAQPSNADANDVIYQMEASRDYDPAPHLESIRARVMAINSADDERNPAELGVMEREIKRVKQGRYVLIPTGPETRGHRARCRA